jgi:hypothetical protein
MAARTVCAAPAASATGAAMTMTPIRRDTLPLFLGLSVVLLASILLPLPAPNGRILGLPSICPFYEMTGLPCPGCGLTRAFVCLGHGRWAEALHWHPIGWLVYGVFVWLWLRAGVTLVRAEAFLPIPPPISRRLWWGAAAGLLLVGAGRILWLTTHHLRF